MEEFKYGDRVEVRDRDDVGWIQAIFIVHDNTKYKYITRYVDSECAVGHKYCRHARPDMKPGQPIVVWTVTDVMSDKRIRIFSYWTEDGLCGCFDSGCLESLHVSCWSGYALLKNYDYSAPVEQF